MRIGCLTICSWCEWPASTLEMQKNWIGRSIGAEVEFGIDRHQRHDQDLYDEA